MIRYCTLIISIVLLSMIINKTLLAQVTTVTINPVLDNTLYENPSGAVSNGIGDYMFIGKTNQPINPVRRSIVQFDIASAIPAGALITDVTLTLRVSRANGSAIDVNLHRALQAWGEGTSNAFITPGQGAPSTTGDATWIHTFYNTGFWTNPGGDFDSTISASISIGGIGLYTWPSTSQMVADVQGWLDNSATNFGWIIIGDESVAGNAKRFNTRSNPSVANRPMLSISYEMPAACGTPTPFASNITFTSVKLNWNAIPGATGYEIQGGKLGGSFISILINDGTTTFKNVAGLTDASTYIWQIQTICDSLSSNFSALDTFTTVPCLTPDTSFTDNISGTSARLNWSLAPNATGYEIKGRKGNGPVQTLNISNGNQSSVTVNSLTPNSSYQWQIRTKCPQGFRSPFSAINTFMTGPGASAKLGDSDILQTIDFEISPNPSKDPLSSKLLNHNLVQDASETFELIIFPNPTSNIINIILPDEIKSNDFEVSLLDINGRSIRLDRKTINESNIMTISTLSVHPGIYQLIIQSEQQLITKKLSIVR